MMKVLQAERIGRGGMAVVHAAVDDQGVDVAVKRLRDDRLDAAELRERLRREARVLEALQGHGVPRFHGLLESERGPELVLERLWGRPLAEELPLDRALARAVHLDVARTLAVAHDLGWVHRDIKPGNIWRLSSGRTVLFDWGLAGRVDDEEPPITQGLPGTPGFLPPEATRAPGASPSRDLYALGVSLLQCTTGLLVPKVATEPVLKGMLATTSLPEDWQTVLLQLLDPDPERRPADATSTAALLATLSDDTGVFELDTAVDLVPVRSRPELTPLELTATETTPLAAVDLPSRDLAAKTSKHRPFLGWLAAAAGGLGLGGAAGLALGGLGVGLGVLLLTRAPLDLRSACITQAERMIADQRDDGGVSGAPQGAPTGWDATQQLASWRAAEDHCGLVAPEALARTTQWLDAARVNGGWAGAEDVMVVANAWAVIAGVDGALATLTPAQNPDGGFGWRPGEPSHPYATVMALTALPPGPAADRAADWVVAEPVVRNTPGLDEQAFVALVAHGRRPDADAMNERLRDRCGDAVCSTAEDGRLPLGTSSVVTQWLPWAAVAARAAGASEVEQAVVKRLVEPDPTLPAYRLAEHVYALAALQE